MDQLRRQLEHSDRLAALGTMAATIAHEFNNLLTPSMSYARLALRCIERGQADAELTQKALHKCQSAGQKAGKICDAILGFARPAGEANAASESDVAAVVNEALTATGRALAKDDITVRQEIPAGLRVAIDPLQLEHVLVNLLLNARQAMHGRRRGTLSLVATVQAGAGGPWARLDVSDTGCGIAAADLPHIFDSFFTTRDASAPAGRGTGLGLSLCRQIIQRHGGQISVQSTPGRGTTFHIILPLRAASAVSGLAA